jgi:hypothetical protein
MATSWPEYAIVAFHEKEKYLAATNHQRFDRQFAPPPSSKARRAQQQDKFYT